MSTVARRVFPRRETPHPLGRHVRHDSASERFSVGVLPKHAIKAVKWQRRIPILNQVQLGKCTSESFTGVAGTDSANGQGFTVVDLSPDRAAKSFGFLAAGAHPLDDVFSTAFYSVETRDDSYPGQYPPTDTGSDALGAMAAAVALGLVTLYQHAMSYAAAVSAIQRGALMWGTTFYNSMFDLDARGYFVVDPASGVGGGHEMVLTGYNPETDDWDGDNSWDQTWGPLDGSFRISGKNLRRLLADDGDVTLPTLAGFPVPPVPPMPTVDAQGLWNAQKTLATSYGLT